MAAQCNVAITDVKITPNPVTTGELFIISVTVMPEQFRIVTMAADVLTDKEGTELICKEE